MNAYLIARFDMTDPDAAPAAYKNYVETAGPAYAAHEARFLARGGEAHPVEGLGRARNVVIEFPSVAQALACYRSETYQKARQFRLPVADGEIVIVEGAVKDRPAQEAGKGYWIGRQDIADPVTYKRYAEGSAGAFEKYGALFLVRGGPHQAMEGQARSRNVLIEFPSVQHALDCFHSPAYKAASVHRAASATGEIVIVAGV
jgi:uncharacterized protein (DUF1330 family)